MSMDRIHDELTGCGRDHDIVASLRSELTAGEQQALESHLAVCPACRREMEWTRRTFALLQTLPVESANRDLAPVIMARINTERNAPFQAAWRTPWVRLTALAAGLLLLATASGFLLLFQGRTHALREAHSLPPRDAAVRWLCNSQEQDGSWDTVKWGAQKQYQVALSALALMALCGDEPIDPADPRGACIARAWQFLLQQQDRDGSFGPLFSGTPYNHAIATIALLQTYARTGRAPELKQPLDRAIHVLQTRQGIDGGWGYLGPDEQSANLAIGAWHIRALQTAYALGWTQTRPALERGRRWLHTVMDAEGNFGYQRAKDIPTGSQTLTAMGSLCFLAAPAGQSLPSNRQPPELAARVERSAHARGQEMDYYQWYFLIAALKQSGRISAAPLLQDLRAEVAGHQEIEGPNTGSWATDDRWSQTGGRIYTTAMAALALQ